MFILNILKVCVYFYFSRRIGKISRMAIQTWTHKMWSMEKDDAPLMERWHKTPKITILQWYSHQWCSCRLCWPWRL